MNKAEDNFDFDCSGPRPRVTNKIIIRSLQLFAKRRKFRYFACRDYAAWDQRVCTVKIIIKRFGNWNKALQMAGVVELGTQRTKDIKTLVEHLEKCWRHLGFRPSSEQLESYSEKVGVAISRKPYRRIWGSVLNACKRIEAFHGGLISEEELLAPPVTKKVRESVPPGMRYDVLKRDSYTCMKCGASRETNKNLRLEVDHIRPLAKEGPTTMENLQTLCHDCNQGKRDKEN